MPHQKKKRGQRVTRIPVWLSPPPMVRLYLYFASKCPLECNRGKKGWPQETRQIVLLTTKNVFDFRNPRCKHICLSYLWNKEKKEWLLFHGTFKDRIKALLDTKCIVINLQNGINFVANERPKKK